jgi:hypothetical protein
MVEWSMAVVLKTPTIAGARQHARHVNASSRSWRPRPPPVSSGFTSAGCRATPPVVFHDSADVFRSLRDVSSDS